ncbi:MAG: phenylalanine--tRNA ligase subunit beta [Brumimicrobium sp.]|nr:phenylalanine--tRNA ligase subunit beta [Brumimicrobium sp.]
MKISYNWLKNYVKTNHTPEKLCEILTDTGLEVEGMEEFEMVKGGLKGVVVGQVISCVQHENADRLKVTRVNIGSEELQIVCGAPNVAEGQKVLVATVGTTLFPNPEESFKIKESKIRGVDSYGMICAEDELGLGASHDGIMVLKDTAKIGQPAAEYLKLASDYRIEIGLTPNRSDAMGHLGVARDIVAYNKLNNIDKSILQLPDISKYNVIENGEKIKIKVEAPQDAPQYRGCLIAGITVGPSPEWLKNYLFTIGLTSINNVVDVTNFVLHELGTPLHAFDLSKVGNEIVVRLAKEGEKLVTLDGVERKLNPQDLMITNGKTNLCIAGVFGGKESGVNENTTSIFLEAAYFNPVSIRKTAKRHALNTDASFRFERGVDPNMVEFAMKRAAALITEVAGGKIVYEADPFIGKKILPAEVIFDFDRCNQLIGKEIEREKIMTILLALDFKIVHRNDNILKLEVPTYRVDVTREADVIEEVLRIYGFNNIPLPQKWNVNLSNQDLRSEEKRQNAIADLLASKGYYEMMNNSLTSSEYITQFGGEAFSIENAVTMLNPLSQDLDVLRQSLIFQGIASLVHNINRQNLNVGLFEFGKIYKRFGEQFIENKRLSIFITGEKEPEQWNAQSKDTSFYTLKGVVEAILERLGLGKFVSTKALKKSILEDGIQLYVQKTKIGEIGWMHTKSAKNLGLKQKAYIADLDWDALLNLGNMNTVEYHPLPKAFAVRRDFSLLLNKQVSYSQIEEVAKATCGKILNEVNLFDVYEGDKLPEGKKSYAVSFYFQDSEKTLNDQVVDNFMSKIKGQLENQLQAELRQ